VADRPMDSRPPPRTRVEVVDHRPTTARLLRRVLDCDVAAFLSLGPGRSCLWLMTWTDGAVSTEVRGSVRGSLASLVAATDLPDRPGVTLHGPGGLDVAPPGSPPLRCQLVVPLRHGADRRTAWLIGRTGRDFSPGDVQLAALLAPGLRLQVGQTDGHDRPGALAALTSRELDVLALVARGLTARAIAHRCGISERTVHKHLEHVYGKLGCRDRLSAVLRARDTGLLTR
jgi:DNA-binding CsgD family transcriptional regulator